jgi:hypothetical protein
VNRASPMAVVTICLRPVSSGDYGSHKLTDQRFSGGLIVSSLRFTTTGSWRHSPQLFSS